MRPSIEPLLGVDKAVQYFSKFCESAHIKESLDCILSINSYLTEENRFDKGKKLSDIVDNFISPTSLYMVNIPFYLRYAVMLLDDKIANVLNEIKSELMLILEYRIPHFVMSKHWDEFVTKYPHLIKYCISTATVDKLNAIKFKKADFIRDTFTKREDDLCDILRTDLDLFQLKETDNEGSLAIYLFDGKHILDEDDIGMGKFQGFKVSGILPYPAWLVMMCVGSTTFHNRIWSGCMFDSDSDFNYIPAMHGVNFDTHICKLIIDYGPLLDYRSCYVITNNLYKDNTTYLFTRSIHPHDGQYTPNVLTKDLREHHNMKGEIRDWLKQSATNIDIGKKVDRKKCVYLPNISMFATRPSGQTHTAFTFINLLNPGGLLLSKLGTPEKRMMKIAKSYRSNIVTQIDNILKNNEVEDMKNVYDMIQSKLDLYQRSTKTTKQHIFHRSFDEALKDLDM